MMDEIDYGDLPELDDQLSNDMISPPKENVMALAKGDASAAAGPSGSAAASASQGAFSGAGNEKSAVNLVVYGWTAELNNESILAFNQITIYAKGKIDRPVSDAVLVVSTADEWSVVVSRHLQKMHKAAQAGSGAGITVFVHADHLVRGPGVTNQYHWVDMGQLPQETAEWYEMLTWRPPPPSKRLLVGAAGPCFSVSRQSLSRLPTTFFERAARMCESNPKLANTLYTLLLPTALHPESPPIHE